MTIEMFTQRLEAYSLQSVEDEENAAKTHRCQGR